MDSSYAAVGVWQTISPPPPPPAADNLRDQRQAALAGVAALTVLVLEIVEKFDEEVPRVWMNWTGSVAKVGLNVAYLTLRYGSVVILSYYVGYQTSPSTDFSSHSCINFSWSYSFFTSVFPLIFGEGMFAVRVYTLHRHSLFLICVIWGIYLVSVGFSLFSWIGNAISVDTAPPVGDNNMAIGCALLPPGHRYRSVISGISGVLCAVVYLVLTVMAIDAPTDERHRSARERWQLVGRNMRRMLQGGSIWFTMAVCVNIATLVFGWNKLSVGLAEILYPFLLCAYAISAARLLLSIRKNDFGYVPRVPHGDVLRPEHIELPEMLATTIPEPASRSPSQNSSMRVAPPLRNANPALLRALDRAASIVAAGTSALSMPGLGGVSSISGSRSRAGRRTRGEEEESMGLRRKESDEEMK